MIKMVNIDLDGTLLDNEGQVSSRTIETFDNNRKTIKVCSNFFKRASELQDM